MSSEKVHLRHCMLYEFWKGQSATQAVANINEVYGPDAVKVKIAQYWLSKFRDGNFNLEDAERSGRPSLFDSDDLRAVINADPFQSCQDIAQTLSTSTSTAFRHLKQIGMVSKLDPWVPHKLTEKQRIAHVNIAASLLTRQHAENFLDRVITGDDSV